MVPYFGPEFLELILATCRRTAARGQEDTAPQAVITEAPKTAENLPERHLGRYSPSFIFLVQLFRAWLM
jgi:hypothetical protein